MDNDDAPVGRILSRREMLALFGGGGAALFLARGALGAAGNAAASTSAANLVAAKLAAAKNGARACIARPELTEGPFFVDEGLNRSDIRLDPLSGKMASGVPLEINFQVSKVGDACGALAGALIDVWQCDALGKYSDIEQNGTSGHKFLRGQQTTDAQGTARFATVIPGWYEGRAVHIHFKIRTPHNGKTHEFTSQFFFDDALIDKIHQSAPYNQKGAREIRNANDGIYQEGGKELVLDLKPKNGAGAKGASAQGYAATFDIALDLSRASSQGRGGPGRGGPGRPPGGDFDGPDDGFGPPPPPDW